jgi:hypothetical protein
VHHGERETVNLDCLPHRVSVRVGRLTASLAGFERWRFDAIRRRHPGLDEGEMQLLFIELTYGKPLANEVRRWKAEQPA